MNSQTNSTFPLPGFQERLDFLTNAGHMMMASSPQIAAYIMYRRNEIITQHDIPVPEVEKHHICESCGSILTPGAGSTITLYSGMRRPSKTEQRKLCFQLAKIKKQTAKTGKKPLTPTVKSQLKYIDRVGSTKITTCNFCSMQTKTQLPLPPVHLKFSDTACPKKPPASKMANKSQPFVSKTQPSSAASTANVITTAAAKKRKKGKNGGLQALLAGQKKPTGGGLSLADFRKK